MEASSNLSDQELISGIRAEDRLIEKSFYEMHYNMVRGLILKHDSNRLVPVEDHYQDVMAIMFLKIKAGKLNDLTSKLSTYVYAVARNLMLYKMRKADKNLTVLTDDYQQAEEDSPTMDLDAAEMTAMEMVKMLRPPCNEILIDWYINQLSYEEIAEKHKYKNANTAKKKKGDCIAEARRQCSQIMDFNK